MPNHAYDDLFDQWGAALNVDPQLAKTVFHVESSGDPNVRDGAAGEIGPMQMKPATAQAMAVKLGLDPKAVDLHDMRWAVPLGMQYLADGMNATQSAEGALGYYNSGSADPAKWKSGYIDKATKAYPGMTLTPPGQDAQPAVNGDAIVATGHSLIGQTGAGINSFLRQHGETLDATKSNWCAAFVNGVLDAGGVQGASGPGKDVATNFLNWGAPVQDAPQAGDVLVIPRGHSAGTIGGHVGIATGHVADGPNGPIYLMQSGNYPGRGGAQVAYSWEPAASVVARRAAPPAQPQQQASAP